MVLIMSNMNNKIVWIDCEMTGLNVEKDALIEIAILITDSDLQLLDEEGLSIPINVEKQFLESMNNFVRKMHTNNGLLQELERGLSYEEAQEKIIKYINKYINKNERPPIAGNSVSIDKMFIHKYMPKIVQYLHYRIIDVSSIKELSDRWYPHIALEYSSLKHKNHRALDDIRESIEELKFYRKNIFVNKKIRVANGT